MANPNIYPIKTDYEDVDKIIGGFYPGELTIIGSRPATGKSSFLLSLIKQISLISFIPGLFFSMDMTVIWIYSSLISIISGIPRMKVDSFFRNAVVHEDFKLDNDETVIVKILLEQLLDFPLIINDKVEININELCDEARKVCKNKSIKIIYIDDFGRITTDNKKEPLTEQASFIIKKLKILAQELNIPIVITCQLYRSAEPNLPTIKDISPRGCTAIENTSDNIILMHVQKSWDLEFRPTKLIVSKNLHGEFGNIDLMFFPNIATFMSTDFIEQL